MKCEKCGEETTNPRFCSHTCSASITNLGRKCKWKKRLDNCLNCSVPLYDKQKKFCTAKCCSEYIHKQKIKEYKDGKKVSPNFLRSYILETREHKCVQCNNTTWNGLPIPLVLDHIDGNSNNDKEENLRLLCSNCDAQTPTYKGKNKGNGRHYRRIRYASGLSY